MATIRSKFFSAGPSYSMVASFAWSDLLSCDQALKAHFEMWKRGLVTFRHIASISGAACPAVLQTEACSTVQQVELKASSHPHCWKRTWSILWHHAFPLINWARMQNQLLTPAFIRQFIFRPSPYPSSAFYHPQYSWSIHVWMGLPSLCMIKL